MEELFEQYKHIHHRLTGADLRDIVLQSSRSRIHSQAATIRRNICNHGI